VACGASRLVDVEFGRGERLYALSQGHWYCGDPGSPAEPNTDALVEGNENGIQGLRSGDIITLVQHRVSGAVDTEVQGRIGSRTGPTASGFQPPRDYPSGRFSWNRLRRTLMEWLRAAKKKNNLQAIELSQFKAEFSRVAEKVKSRKGEPAERLDQQNATTEIPRVTASFPAISEDHFPWC